MDSKELVNTNQGGQSPNLIMLDEKICTDSAVLNQAGFILDIKGTGNQVYLSSFQGSGKIEIKMNNVKNCTVRFGRNNRVNNRLTLTFYNVY